MKHNSTETTRSPEPLIMTQPDQMKKTRFKPFYPDQATSRGSIL